MLKNKGYIIFFRYVAVGIATTCIYVLCYLAMRLVISVSPWGAATAALVVAIAFQYIGHSQFTFQRNAQNLAQGARFLITIITGFMIASLISGVIWPIFRWPEAWSVALIVVLIPTVNFITFSLWVFEKS